VIVHTPPARMRDLIPWLGMIFRCGACGVDVEFELKDLKNRAIRFRDDRVENCRCPVCAVITTFTLRDEVPPMPNGETPDDAATLIPCVLCGHPYRSFEMWPRPDGHVCDECSMKVIDDAQ
jgi:hypothetical protein